MWVTVPPVPKDESGSGPAFLYHYKNNNTKWLEWVENLRNQAAGNYAYDGNGNLVQDASKNLVNITYDYRNLPTRIEFNLAEDLLLNIGSPITGVRLFRALNTITTQNDFIIESGGDVTMQAGSTITLTPGFHPQSGSDFHAEIDPNIGSREGNAISYTYNQAGNRIAKSTSDNVTLHYIRGVDGQTIAVLDENDTPLFYNIAGVGKLVPGNPDVSYYYLTDQLGSIRVIIQEDGTVLSHTDYYPFGMQMTGRVVSGLSSDFYKYNAKQLDDEYGLNWLDYGWRPYDGEVGRWFVVDPLADQYPSFSPYIYAANNPVLFIDPDGKDVVISGEDSLQALKKLNEETHTTFGFDEDGKLVVRKKASFFKRLFMSKREKTLIEAVNDNNILVNLKTTRDNSVKGSDGTEVNMVVGLYDGSEYQTINGEVTKVVTSQFINMRHAQVLEKETGASVGGSVIHEINESYFGAQKYPGQGYSELFYKDVHRKAAYMDKQPAKAWIMGVNPVTRQVGILITEPTGKQRFVPLYTVPMR